MITNNYFLIEERLSQLRSLRENIFDITIEGILTNKDVDRDKEKLKVAFLALEDNASEVELDKFYNEYITCITNILDCIDDRYIIDWCKKDEVFQPTVIKEPESKRIHFEFSSKTKMMDNALWLFDYANDECNIKNKEKVHRKEL